MSAAGPNDATPSYVVFDSGLGGLSIVRALRERGLGGRLVYVADHAGFPNGALSEEAMLARVEHVAAAAIDRFDPAAFVVACNTASTVVLPRLRARWSIPFVGTVPAIKPAAQATRSGRISILATPATVRRDYTKELIAEFAADKAVTLVGAPRLAELAEAALLGETVDPAAVAAEIAPAFVAAEQGGRGGAAERTDVIVLACTHYPLALDLLARAAPWPVIWLDPAEAIARRLADVAPQLQGVPEAGGVFVSTADASAARRERLSTALRVFQIKALEKPFPV